MRCRFLTLLFKLKVSPYKIHKNKTIANKIQYLRTNTKFKITFYIVKNSTNMKQKINKFLILIRSFLTATSGTKPIIDPLGMFIFSCTKERNEEVPLSTAIGNVELMHESFPKH